MAAGPVQEISTLAVCQGVSVVEQLLGVAIAVLLLVGWGAFVWFFLWSRRSGSERGWLFTVLVGSGLIGILMLVSLHDDLEDMIALSLFAAVAVGAGAAIASKRIAVLPAIGAAIAGDLAFPLAVLALVILVVSLGDGCLGEELG